MRDGSFHLGHFGRNVLNLFNPDLGPGQEWIDRTLAFFDSQTPGLNAAPTPHDEPEVLADDDPRNDLAAMRRAAQRRRIEVDDEDYYADDVDDNHYDGMWVDQQEDARRYLRDATEDPGSPQAPEVQVPRRNTPLPHTNTRNAREGAHRDAPRSQVNTRVREDIHHSNARRDVREDPRHAVFRNARDATEDPTSPQAQQTHRRNAPPPRHAVFRNARDATEDPTSPQAQQSRCPQARDATEDPTSPQVQQTPRRNAPPPQASTRDAREDTQRASRSQVDTRNVREGTHRPPPQANTRDAREDTQRTSRSRADTRNAREPRPAEPTLPRYAPRPKPAHLVVRDDSISPEPEESPVRQLRPTINGFLGRVIVDGITERPWSPGAVMAEQRCREAGEHAATLGDPLSPRAAASDDEPLSELPSSPSPPPISKAQQKKRGGTGRENVPPTRRKSSRARARK